MYRVISSVLLIIFGLVVVIFNKFFERGASNFSYKLSHEYFFSQKVGRISFIITGLIFVVLGILSLLDIIK